MRSRWLALAAGACLAGLLWAPPGGAAAIPGDVDKNGLVEMGDVALLHRYVVGDPAVVLDSEQQTAADVAPLVGGVSQPDGLIDAGDLVVIHRAAAGEISLPRTLGNPAIIDNQQTWEPGAPYIVPQDLEIAATGNLTLLPGTEIRFGTGGALILQPGGVLDAQGSTGSRVVLTPDGTSSPGDWDGLKLTAGGSGSSPVTLTLNEVEIRYANKGIDASGANLAIAVTGGLISDFLTTGIEISNNSSATIDGTTIDNAGARRGRGIEVTGDSLGTVHITGCTIQGAERGIHVASGGALIQGNTIQDNNQGVYAALGGDPVVNSLNVITENNHGVYAKGNGVTNNPEPVINDNQIYGNTVQDLFATLFRDARTTEIDAKNNWWGNLEPIWIANQITDASDDPSNQQQTPWVRFLPFDQSDGTPYEPPGVTYLWRSVPGATTTVVSGAGPHAIVGRVTVPSDATLTFQAGAQVDVGNTSELIVEGTLDVAGTQGGEVVFESAEVLPAVADWEGIYVAPGSLGSTINHAWIHHAERPIDVDAAELTISDSQITLFQGILQLRDAGIRYANGGTGAITGTLIDGILPGAPPTAGVNYGITLLNSSVAISGNEIRNNKIAVFLWGDGTLPLPAAFTGNSLHMNTDYNLRIEQITNPVPLQGGGVQWLTLDAKENYWGTPDAADARDTISQQVPAFETQVSIDFSDLLDGIGGVPIPGTLLAFAIQRVEPDRYEFNPAFNEELTLTFDLAAEADVTLKICQESNDPCNTVLFQDTDHFMPGTGHTLAWDGTDGINPLAPGAYIYVLDVVDATPGDGVNEGTYNPAYAPQVDADPSVVRLNQDPVTGLTPVDPETNLAAVWEVTLDYPSRLALRVDGAFEIPAAPFPPGTSTIRWAARDASGLPLEGEMAAYIWDNNRMKANAVILRGEPVITGAPPAIEVRTNPHRLYRSYGNHASDFTYRVDQDSAVTVTLLPPGVTDPGMGIPVTSGSQTANIDYTVPLDPSAVATYGDGIYAIHIEATANGVTGTHLSSVRLLR